ncbi:hypothetical protein [Flavobacterium filum]|uniref:hypothetical protein n=1 Tax=Flavobacterium filum TaxID=370974 RepID=UPI0023F27D39|nr:hypothetical protein [Flavobacterium filum]
MNTTKTQSSEFTELFVLSHMDTRQFKKPFVLKFRDPREMLIITQALSDYMDRLDNIKESYQKNAEMFMSDLTSEKYNELTEASNEFLSWIDEDLSLIEEMDSQISRFFMDQTIINLKLDLP